MGLMTLTNSGLHMVPMIEGQACDKVAKITFIQLFDVNPAILPLDDLKILMEVKDGRPLLPILEQSVSNANFISKQQQTSIIHIVFGCLASSASVKKQVKAIYDFNGENANELNLYAGDIITVVEEIDDGWWMGELYDANGNKQQGLFPSNYIEEIAPPPMPARQLSNRSRSNSHYSQTSETREITEEPEEESPFADSSGISNSYSQPSPPKPMMARRGTAGSLYSTPNGSPALARMPSASTISMRNNIGSSRTPPPPPTARTPSRSFTTGSHTAPTTPMGRSSNSYFTPQVTNVPHTHPTCPECGCDEFSADVFKPNRCKSCFHYHG
jgi:hypothetical protein